MVDEITPTISNRMILRKSINAIKFFSLSNEWDGKELAEPAFNTVIAPDLLDLQEILLYHAVDAATKQEGVNSC